MFKLDKLQDDAINLLKDLISIQSFSFEEDKTATKINNWLKERGVKSDRKVNNIIAYNKHYDQTKPNILLNSHHDISSSSALKPTAVSVFEKDEKKPLELENLFR